MRKEAGANKNRAGTGIKGYGGGKFEPPRPPTKCRRGYNQRSTCNHLISNKLELNRCFIKFSSSIHIANLFFFLARRKLLNTAALGVVFDSLTGQKAELFAEKAISPAAITEIENSINIF